MFILNRFSFVILAIGFLQTGAPEKRHREEAFYPSPNPYETQALTLRMRGFIQVLDNSRELLHFFAHPPKSLEFAFINEIPDRNNPQTRFSPFHVTWSVAIELIKENIFPSMDTKPEPLLFPLALRTDTSKQGQYRILIQTDFGAVDVRLLALAEGLLKSQSDSPADLHRFLKSFLGSSSFISPVLRHLQSTYANDREFYQEATLQNLSRVFELLLHAEEIKEIANTVLQMGGGTYRFSEVTQHEPATDEANAQPIVLGHATHALLDYLIGNQFTNLRQLAELRGYSYHTPLDLILELERKGNFNFIYSGRLGPPSSEADKSFMFALPSSDAGIKVTKEDAQNLLLAYREISSQHLPKPYALGTGAGFSHEGYSRRLPIMVNEWLAFDEIHARWKLGKPIVYLSGREKSERLSESESAEVIRQISKIITTYSLSPLDVLPDEIDINAGDFVGKRKIDGSIDIRWITWRKLREVTDPRQHISQVFANIILIPASISSLEFTQDAIYWPFLLHPYYNLLGFFDAVKEKHNSRLLKKMMPLFPKLCDIWQTKLAKMTENYTSANAALPILQNFIAALKHYSRLDSWDESGPIPHPSFLALAA